MTTFVIMLVKEKKNLLEENTGIYRIKETPLSLTEETAFSDPQNVAKVIQSSSPLLLCYSHSCKLKLPAGLLQLAICT